MRVNTLTIVALAAFFTGGLPGWAITAPDDEPVDLGPITPPDPALAAKLGGTLLAYVHHQTLCSSVVGGDAACLPADADGYVVVDVVAAEGYTTADLIAALAPLGFEVRSAYEQVVTGRLPAAQIAQLASVAALQFAYHPEITSSAGSVPGDGDVAQLSNVIRQGFGLTGRGQRVGVISNSFNCLGGFAADRASGDLPRKVEVLAENDSCDGGSGSTDEGRAMLQIVHDVAPEARLLFATGWRGVADLANGIRSLVDEGATVVVDDVAFLNEPWYQEGLIQQAVRDVANTYNAVHVTAAGNWNRAKTYESAFRPSSRPVPNGVYMDFDPGAPDTNSVRVLVPPGPNSIVLQWAQPFRSVSGGQGAITNLDLYLFTDAGSLIGRSETLNIESGEPIESINFNNPNAGNTDYRVAIINRGGPNPARLRLLSPRAVTFRLLTNSSTILAHQNTREAITVGAANYRKTPAYGLSLPEIESFSSPGLVPIIFDGKGNLVNVVPLKPEIVGPDGVNTTFFGSGDTDQDGFPNFLGTSAAAPSVAGVVAQLKQDQPWVRPGHIRKAIVKSGIDMDDALTPAFDVGYDRQTGFGLLDAAAALAYLRAPTDLVPLVQLLHKDKRAVLRFEGSDTPQAANLRLTPMGKIRDAQGAAIYSVWRIRNISSDPDDIHIVTLKSADGLFKERFRVPARTDTYVLSTVAEGQARHTLRYEKTAVYEYDTSTGYVRTSFRFTGTVATSDSSPADFEDATLVPDTF